MLFNDVSFIHFQGNSVWKSEITLLVADDLSSVELDFTLECDATPNDLNGVDAAEGRWQVDVSLYIDIGREDNVSVFIQQLNR